MITKFAMELIEEIDTLLIHLHGEALTPQETDELYDSTEEELQELVNLLKSEVYVGFIIAGEGEH